MNRKIISTIMLIFLAGIITTPFQQNLDIKSGGKEEVINQNLEIEQPSLASIATWNTVFDTNFTSEQWSYIVGSVINNITKPFSTVTGDAYVDSSSPTSNWNTGALMVGLSTRFSFIKWAESGYFGNGNVTLRLYCTAYNTGADTLNIYNVSVFDESTVTYNNQPQLYSPTPIATFNSLVLNSYNNLPLLENSIAIEINTTSSNYDSFNSKDSGSNLPEYLWCMPKVFNTSNYILGQTNLTNGENIDFNTTFPQLNLYKGDKISINFNTTSTDTDFTLNLTKDGVLNQSLLVTNDVEKPTQDQNVQLILTKNATINQITFGGNVTHDKAYLRLNSIKIEHSNATPPDYPAIFSGSRASESAVLTWNPPVDNGGSTIENYTIYRSLTSGTETLWKELGNVLTYTDTGLTNGQPYYYKITANNSIGEGNISSEIMVIPASVPTKPLNLFGYCGVKWVNLTWAQPANLGGTGFYIENYTIYRDNIKIYVTPNNATTYKDTGLADGHTYVYKITANNTVGEGAFSDAYNVTTIAGIPVNLTATGGDKKITLNWLMPENGGEVSGYKIYRSSLSGAEGYITTVTTKEYVDTGAGIGLVNGNKYYYVITSLNTVGNESAQSTEIWCYPTLPLTLTFSTTGTIITVNWDNIPYITKYSIYRSHTNGFDYTSLTPITNVTTNKYEDNVGTDNGPFFYQVLGYNAAGDLVVLSDIGTTYYSPGFLDDPKNYLIYIIIGASIGGIVGGGYLIFRYKNRVQYKHLTSSKYKAPKSKKQKKTKIKLNKKYKDKISL